MSSKKILLRSPIISDATKESGDFEDSLLIAVSFIDLLGGIQFVVRLSQNSAFAPIWAINCYEILGFHIDASTFRTRKSKTGILVNDIYTMSRSPELERWHNHLETIGLSASSSRPIYHIVFDTPDYRPLEDESVLGISIICKRIEVIPAELDYPSESHVKS